MENVPSIVKFAFTNNIWYNSKGLKNFAKAKKESELYFKKENNIPYKKNS